MSSKNRSERLFELLSDMDDRFITEAAPKEIKKTSHKWKQALGLGLSAAAAAVLIWQGGKFIKQPDIPIDPDNDNDSTIIDNLNRDPNVTVDPDTLPIDETMPEPIKPYGEGTGGDECAMFYATVNIKLNNIDGSLMDQVGWDEAVDWINETSSSQCDKTSVSELANLYSFFRYFDFSDEAIRENLIAMRGSEPDYRYALTDAEIDLLISGDAAAIAKHFASEYAIVKGERLFSPKWMYWHTVEDYEAVGITPEDVKEKLYLYYTSGLGSEGLNAFYHKLASYVDGIEFRGEVPYFNEMLEITAFDEAVIETEKVGGTSVYLLAENLSLYDNDQLGLRSDFSYAENLYVAVKDENGGYIKAEIPKTSGTSNISFNNGMPVYRYGISDYLTYIGDITVNGQRYPVISVMYYAAIDNEYDSSGWYLSVNYHKYNGFFTIYDGKVYALRGDYTTLGGTETDVLWYYDYPLLTSPGSNVITSDSLQYTFDFEYPGSGGTDYTATRDFVREAPSANETQPRRWEQSEGHWDEYPIDDAYEYPIEEEPAYDFRPEQPNNLGPVRQPLEELHPIDLSNLPFDYYPLQTAALPKIDSGVYNAGLGSEGDYYTLEELERFAADNCWKPKYVYDTLPVFKVRGSTKYAGMKPFSFTEEELMAKLQLTAAFFNGELSEVKCEYLSEGSIDPEDYEILKDSPKSISARIENMGIRLHIYSDGELDIKFEYPSAMPEGYAFNENSDLILRARGLEFIAQSYNGIIGYNEYDYRDMTLLPRGDNVFNEMIEQNFNKTYVTTDNSGNLTRLVIDNELESLDCEGFYPTITWQEAQNMLISGECINTNYLADQYTGFEQSAIKAVTLTYKYNTLKDHALPYYMFMVEVPDELGRAVEGEYHCVPFYVPAIKQEYLEDANAIFD